MFIALSLWKLITLLDWTQHETIRADIKVIKSFLNIKRDNIKAVWMPLSKNKLTSLSEKFMKQNGLQR